jgi:LPS export ABC transporter protein LptC
VSRRACCGAAALAALAALVAGCAEPAARPGTINVAADTADQTLEHVRHYITRDGVQKSLIEADTAYYYEGSQSFELRVVKVTFFGENGDTSSVLTSREATYRAMTGAMEGRGNVVVVSTDGTRSLRSEKLDYDPGKNEISTDQHYTYIQGGNHLEGDGFTSDPNFQRMTTAKPRGKAAEGVVLPGQ